MFLNRKRQSVTDSFYKLKLCFCLLLIIQLIFFEHSFSVISCYFYRIERTKYLSKYIHISFKNYINSILGLFHEKKERGERERERERDSSRVIKIKVSSFSNEPSSLRATSLVLFINVDDTNDRWESNEHPLFLF